MTTANDTATLAETNKALVTEFMQVFSTGDVERVLGYLSDSATWWVSGSLEGVSGTKTKEEFGQLLGGIGASTKAGAVTLTPSAFTAEGDRVAVEAESHAELKNDGVYNNLYHFLFEIRDGRIERVKEFMDTDHARATFLGPAA